MFYVTGQAAKLVTASAAASKTSDAEYKKVQEQRASEAKEALQKRQRAASSVQGVQVNGSAIPKEKEPDMRTALLEAWDMHTPG